MIPEAVHIPVAAGAVLEGDLGVVEGAMGLVLFAHGSGSSRHSPRNRAVAAELRRRGLATLLGGRLRGRTRRQAPDLDYAG